MTAAAHIVSLHEPRSDALGYSLPLVKAEAKR